MELCTRTFKTLFFNPSFSLPSSSSNSHLLRLNNTLKPFKFNLSFIQPSLYHHTSSPFTISASSSSSSSSSPVELYSENDRLPAKLKVTETPESNSRVCSSFFTTIFSFTLSQFFICVALLMLNLIFRFVNM
jgi:hypothetical protein